MRTIPLQVADRAGASTACARPDPIVVFGEDWGSLPSSTQHLMRHLAEDRAVLWINSIGMRRPRLTRRDLVRTITKVRAALARSRRDCDGAVGLSVLSPLAVAWPGVDAIDRLNGVLLGRQIARALVDRSMVDPIVWTSLPTAAPLLDAIGARRVVYYCGDDYSALEGVDPCLMADLEREVVARADLVVTASETLAVRFPSGKSMYLPHGADIGLFQTPQVRAVDLPQRPCVGYYGSIADWLDLDMLRDAALALPDFDFVLIGQVRVDVTAIAALPNVRLLGPRAHCELPSYSQHWTVSILPYLRNRQIDFCNPLKLREYLAVGTPIATTLFSALRPYADLLAITRDREGFASAIVTAAADAARNPQRRERVQGETWSARAAELDDRLRRLT